MNKRLFFQAILKFTLGLIIVGLLIFLPAWTLYFIQGWFLITILFVPMFIAGIVMLFKSPELLEKRLNAKESENDQKFVILFSGLLFTVSFVLAGLNYRFDWFVLPFWVSIIFAIVFLFSYAIYAEVLRENAYLSRTIEVQENQKVIDTGLYGIVRHPMYMTTLLLFLSIPLVLGSVISFAVMILYIPLIVIRIKNEEKVLESGLEGYSEYKKKVKYRLIPFIW